MTKVFCDICKKISIHAPREGGDYQISALHGVSVISIHAPREGGDRVSAGCWLPAA